MAVKYSTTSFETAENDGLVFNSFDDNTGGWGYKAEFSFEGQDPDADNCFLVNATWNVSQNNSPYLQIAPADSPSSPLSGLTAKVVASEVISGKTYQGNLEVYPLPAGSYVATWIIDGGNYPAGTLSFSVGNNELKAKDLSSGTLASSISASTSTLSVYVGEGTNSEIMSVWPTTPFYATIMPVSPSAGVPNKLDSEIVLVSNVSVDGNGNTTLSVSRGQRGTTAKAFSAGDIITNASYAEDAPIISDEGTPEDPTPWITADMLTPEARRQIAEESGVVAYINGARGGNWGSTWAVYTDTTYANIYPADEIDDAIEAGVSVVFRTNDNYDLRILGRFSVDSTYKYYTVAYDGFLLGTLRLTISSGLWNYTESQVQTADIADSAITTAKINNLAVTNAKIANNTIESGKIDWSSPTAGNFATPVTSGHPYDTSSKYAKMLRLDFGASWKTVATRFTLASTQAATFIYDVVLAVRRGNNVVESVELTAWKLKTTAFDLASNLKLVAISNSQFELYLYLPSTIYSPMLTVYSFTSYDPRANNFGKLTMYENVAVSSLPSGTQYSCTVKDNLIS